MATARPLLRAASLFAPPLALMGVIFFLSAQPDLNSGLGVWDTIGRKFVHFAIFGALWWLWDRALDHRHGLVAAAITVAYAISDEYHQSFVDGRVGSVRDVLIDTAGVLAAWALTRRLARRQERRQSG
ncbi:MAG: VanZ family protein [Solirubrobacterales bacterium]